LQKAFFCIAGLMTQYKVFDEAIVLKVKTKRPEKWLLIDRETGQVYQGNPKGYWDRLEPHIKENEE
jgi:hypothetical protein